MIEKQTRITGDAATAPGMAMPGFEEMPEHLKPAAVVAARVQGEWMRLVARRAEAWMGLPQQVLACRDLGDLAKLQTGFLAAMGEHYADCARHAMDAGAEPAVRQDGPTDGGSPRTGRDGERAQEQRKAA